MLVGVLEAVLQLRDEMSAQLDAVAPSLDRLGAKIASAGFALLPLSAGLTAIGTTSLTAATNLNSGLANVSALLTDLAFEQVPSVMAIMKDQVESLAVTYGKSTTDMNEGLYEIISVLGYTTDTFYQLDISAKAGAAGLATTKDAFGAISAVALTYGDVSRDAFEKIADLSFQAVNLGKITFPELSAAIGNVAPAAARLGVSFEELYAVLTTASGVTGTVSQGSTQLVSALNALENPTKNMSKLYDELGIESGKAGIAQFGLGEMLRKVVQYAEEAGVPLMSLTRRKEANTIATSVGVQQYGRYVGILGEMGTASDKNTQILTGSFQRQTEGINKTGFAWEQLKAKVEVARIHLGDALMPTMDKLIVAFTPLIDNLLEVVDWFGKWPEPVKAVTIAMAAFLAALAPVIIAVGGLTLAYAALAPFFPVFITFFSAVGPIILAVGAAVLGTLMYWDDLKEAMDVVSYTPLYALFKDGLLGVFGLMRVAATQVTDAIKLLSFGFIDIEATARNAGTVFDALKLTWIAAKSVVLDLGIAFMSAKAMLMFDGDPMKVELEKDIQALKDLKLTYSDSANSIVNNTKPAVNAVKEFAPPLNKLNDQLNDTKKGTDELGGAHRMSAEETAKHAKKLQEAEKAAIDFAKATVEATGGLAQIVAIPAGHSIAEMFDDAGESAKRLVQATLPVSVQVMNAAIASRQSAIETKAWDAEVDRLIKQFPQAEAELEKLKKGTVDVKEKSYDWGKALDVVTDVMKAFGVTAESSLMKAIVGFQGALAISKQLKESLDEAGVSAKDFFKLEGAQQAQIAMAGLNTAVIAYQSGALGGAAAGATFGSSFGFLGAAIGGAAGFLLGWAGQNSKAQAEARKLAADLEKQRQAFIESNGGLATLEAMAREAGLTLDNLFRAKTVAEYNEAVKELNKQFELQKEATDGLKSAMEKYGLTISDLGPKFRQQELDKIFADLFRDYSLLTAAGVDHNLVIEKMSPELNKYVQTAVSAGSTIPESMRPILQRMLDLGLLTNEAGDAMTSLEDLNFAESLTDSVKTLVDKINELVNALLGIPNINRTVTITTIGANGPGPGNEGNEGPETNLPAADAARGFLTNLSTIGQTAVAQGGRPGVSSPATIQRDLQMPDLYFIINANDRTVQQTTASEARRMQAVLDTGMVQIPARIITQRAS